MSVPEWPDDADTSCIGFLDFASGQTVLSIEALHELRDQTGQDHGEKVVEVEQ